MLDSDEYSDDDLPSDIPTSNDSSDDDLLENRNRRRGRGSRDEDRRVRSRGPRVVLAKIFMVTPDPDDRQKNIIAEWDGTDPGHDKKLFVHAKIADTTCEEYLTLGDLDKRKLDYLRNLGDGRSYHRDYAMRDETPRQGVISYIHNPPKCIRHSELSSLLSNFMTGNLSFENERTLRERHRIYMFYTPPSPGLTSNMHLTVTPLVITYWYKLNNLHGQDDEEQLLNLDYLISSDRIRRVSESEFELNYPIFDKFKVRNVEMSRINLESGINLELQLSRVKPRYTRINGPNSVSGSRNSRRGGKKRNKTRRKYRKIKSRRRRVIR